ncbi:MAG: hypothetical protein KAT68_15080 [Bacteroidales bacterium]|nr:hypothetical protein [Bacteroidales bacterium]
MKDNETIIKTIEAALNSSKIPEHEKNAIITKLEEALDLNLVAESDRIKLIEIKNDLSSTNNESQILKILARLIELIIIFSKSFFE